MLKHHDFGLHSVVFVSARKQRTKYTASKILFLRGRFCQQEELEK